MAQRKRTKRLEESNEVLKRRATELAQAADTDVAKAAPEMFALLFWTNNEPYAIDADEVVEILHDIPITWLPFAAEVIAGVINLRGDIVTVFNVTPPYESSITPTDREQTVVIVGRCSRKFGILVEMIDGIMEVNQGEIIEVINDDRNGEYVQSAIKREKNLYQILDPTKFIASKEFEIDHVSS